MKNLLNSSAGEQMSRKSEKMNLRSSGTSSFNKNKRKSVLNACMKLPGDLFDEVGD